MSTLDQAPVVLPPDIAARVLLDGGRVYITNGTEQRTTRDGAPIDLLVVLGACAVCGALFKQLTTRPHGLLRTCPEHRGQYRPRPPRRKSRAPA